VKRDDDQMICMICMYGHISEKNILVVDL